MKYLYSILLVLIGFSSTTSLFAQAKFPIGNYQQVKYYKIRSGFGEPKPETGFPLSATEVQQFLGIIQLPESYLPYQSACFSPKEAIIFWDSKGNKMFEMLISLNCHNFKANPELPIAYASGFSVKAEKQLQDFLKPLQEATKPALPKGKKAANYVVLADESWGVVADKLKTSVELLKVMNGEEPSLNADWDKQNIVSKGRKLAAVQEVQNYLYPTTTEPNLVAVEPSPPALSSTQVVDNSVPTPTSLSLPRELQPADSEPAIKNLNTQAELSNQGYYVVKSGDSLYKIANSFGTTLEKLVIANKLLSDKLQVGQKILIVR